jgi:hypothetical protein
MLASITIGCDDVYNYCGKKGHWAKECRKKKHDEAAQAHLAQGEEEEQSMLMAHFNMINPWPPPTASSAPPPRHAVHISE